MSQLNVNTIKNRTGVGGISLPHGANSAGVITATSLDSRELIGDVNVGGAVTISGNLTVQGTETIINTSSLEVEDKTVGVGSTSNPSDASANGAGLVVYGTTEKSLTWGTSGYKWTLAGGGLQAQDVSVTGVVTAASFKGDGSTLSGIDAAPVFSATASGTIANGNTVIVNADATVSAAATTEVSAGTGSLQAVSLPSNVYTTPQDAVWISKTKYISFWIQWNNNEGLYAQVGTVSGTTITFGTNTQIRSGVTNMSWASCDYDAVNEVVLVAHGTDPVEVIGLTISGTTITENTSRAVISGYNCASGAIRSDQKGGFMFIKIRNTGDSTFTAGTYTSSGAITIGSEAGGYGGYNTGVYRTNCALTYDPDSDKFVGTLLDGTTQTRVTIGGRSGSAATMTNPGLLNYSSGNGPNAIVYDTANDYFIMFYRKSGGGGITAKLFTMNSDGASITVGTTVDTFDNSDPDDYMEARYSPATGKVYVYFYETTGTASMRLLTVTMPGTISGTPSHTDEAVGSASDIGKCGGLAISNDGTILTQQRGGGTPYYNYNRIKQEQVITTNLLSYNFIGFSADNYTDGQTVKIKTVGNIDANLSGLIPGTRYYVQRGGELNSSAGTPSVYAGLALNATTIAIKLPFS